MAVITKWTGADACRLQDAARMTHEELAAKLGVHPRTVAGWHERPATVPRPELQRALDTVLDRLDPGSAERFAGGGGAGSGGPQPLTVAMAVVARAGHVLLVQRRSDTPGLSWGFPAGVAKPGADPEVTACRETLAETGVRCRVVRDLGQRVHPLTGVLARYFLCEHLAGEPVNGDPVENADAVWAPIADLNRFVPLDRVFGPVLDALEAA